MTPIVISGETWSRDGYTVGSSIMENTARNARHTFLMHWKSPASACDIESRDGQHTFILPFLYYHTGFVAASSADWVSLHDFIQNKPLKKERQQPRIQSQRSKVDKNAPIFKKHPALAKLLGVEAKEPGYIAPHFTAQHQHSTSSSSSSLPQAPEAAAQQDADGDILRFCQ